jgi:phthalate 4,5-dioxygenase oxygenase subunit
MPAAEVEGSTATDSAWLRPSTDKAPRLLFEATAYGFRYAAIRKPIRNPETH